jgi:hypothetical protein
VPFGDLIVLFISVETLVKMSTTCSRLGLFIIVLTMLMGLSSAGNCSQYSSPDMDDYWEAVGRCPACTGTEGCGYCMSTLLCSEGNSEGPDGYWCSAEKWAFGSEEKCPGK